MSRGSETPPLDPLRICSLVAVEQEKKNEVWKRKWLSYEGAEVRNHTNESNFQISNHHVRRNSCTEQETIENEVFRATVDWISQTFVKHSEH